MPQMSPMDWYMLSIFFLIVNYFIMVLIYFLYFVKLKKVFKKDLIVMYKILW